MKEYEIEARKDYVDYMKAIGIILVILGHINFANSEIKQWIYSFHMPLFFFTSGLTIKKTDKRINEYVMKKMRNLLVPYVLWGLIYAGFSFKNLAFILYGNHVSLSRAESLTSLWFLPVMFLALCYAKMFNILNIFGGGGMLQYIGKNTFTIFVIHKPIISIFAVLFSYLELSQGIALVGSCVGVLCISCIGDVVIKYFVPIFSREKHLQGDWLGKPESLIAYVGDCKDHDMRYAIASTKIYNKLDWLPETKFGDGIKKIIQWYFDERVFCYRNSKAGVRKVEKKVKKCGFMSSSSAYKSTFLLEVI